MLSSQILALSDVICCSIRYFQNIFEVFSICAAGSYFEECIFRQQVIIQASFVKDTVYYF